MLVIQLVVGTLRRSKGAAHRSGDACTRAAGRQLTQQALGRIDFRIEGHLLFCFRQLGQGCCCNLFFFGFRKGGIGAANTLNIRALRLVVGVGNGRQRCYHLGQTFGAGAVYNLNRVNRFPAAAVHGRPACAANTDIDDIPGLDGDRFCALIHSAVFVILVQEGSDLIVLVLCARRHF